LFFLLKVEQFENFKYPSFEARAEAAFLMYDTYIHPAGLLYISTIPSAVRKITKEILSRCTEQRSESISVAFNAAKLQVWDVLELVFSHFKDEKGPISCLLDKHFGMPRFCFSANQPELESILFGPNALNLIVGRISHHVCTRYGTFSDPTSARPASEVHVLPFEVNRVEQGLPFEKRRGELIKRVVAAFCKECLETDSLG
jgi:hypothetical protein